MYISATAELYSKMYSFGMTLGFFCPLRCMLLHTVRFIVKMISISDEILFFRTAVGYIASYFVKII